MSLVKVKDCPLPHLTCRMVVMMMVMMKVRQGRPGAPSVMASVLQVQRLVVGRGVAAFTLPLAVGLGGGPQLAVLAAPGLVLVVWVVLLVLLPQALRLLDERPLVALVQEPGGGRDVCFRPLRSPTCYIEFNI